MSGMNSAWARKKVLACQAIGVGDDAAAAKEFSEMADMEAAAARGAGAPLDRLALAIAVIEADTGECSATAILRRVLADLTAGGGASVS